ncbi:MAG: Ig-like domain repeat protein [SAR202 cluster bacterium]|nr:Ig-like domain repeat protein [SAR202 cluster bacterium]
MGKLKLVAVLAAVLSVFLAATAASAASSSAVNLTAPSSSVVYGKSVVFTAKLYKGTRLIQGGTIQFRLGSCTGQQLGPNKTTNASGIATYTMDSTDFNVGLYTIAACYTGNLNDYLPSSRTRDIRIDKKTLTISGYTANDNVYNSGRSATVVGSPVLNGIVGDDEVAIVVNGLVGTFDDKNVGVDKPVHVKYGANGLVLGGAHQGNYKLAPLTLYADITPRALTVTGLSAQDKPFDGNTAAVITGTPVLSGITEEDSGERYGNEPTVTLSGTPVGTFESASVGDGKAVTVSGLSIEGPDAGNYDFSLPVLFANIELPVPTAFVTANNAAAEGKAEAGDTFTVTMNESAIDLGRIISGWTGAETAVVLRFFNNNVAFGGNDGIAVCTGSGMPTCVAGGTGSQNILGTVDLGSTEYIVTNNVDAPGTLSWDSNTQTFTVTVGTCTSQCTRFSTGGSSTATFKPINGATQAGGLRDTAGNGATQTVNEVGVHF